MSQTPTNDATSAPAIPATENSEEAAIASFARLLAVEDPEKYAAPSPANEQPESQDAEADAADEPVAEDEAPEDAEASDEESEESEADPIYTVKVDGKPVEVPLSELIAGYSRQSDYTRKTMALSEERKAFEAERAGFKDEITSLAGVREEYGKRLAALDEALAEVTGSKEPDWDALKDDPVAYAKAFTDWQLQARRQDAIRAERERVQQEQAAQQQQQRDEFIRAQQAKVLDLFPDWKDQAKAKAAHDAILAYATEAGFTPDELGQVYDARLVKLLHDAAQFRAISDTVKKAPPPIKKAAVAPPPQPAKRPVSEVTRQKQRLAKTGNETDFAELLLKQGIVK